MPRITDVRLRKGTAAQWASANPILSLGEPGFETDTKKLKFGDGTTTWNSLPYFTSALPGYLDQAALDAAYAAIDHVHPDVAANMASGLDGLTIGSTRIKPGVDARYSAFPSITELADGRLFMVWFEGTDHVTSRDGIVRGAYSSDNGLTWGSATTVLSMASTDLRDPTVSTNADGSIVYLTYFKGTNAVPANGFFIRRGDANGTNFGAEVRIDPSQPYAAGCSPVVLMANGSLLATWYGKAVGTDAYDSVWVSISTNDGTTWGTPTKIVDGVAAGMDMQEPWATVSGTNVIITHRRGNAANIGRVASTNNGAAWGSSVTLFAGTGRPATIVTSSGMMIVSYRDPSVQFAAMHGLVRYSRDLGVTWSGARMLEPAAAGFWVYTAMLETIRNQVLAVSAVEESGTSAVLSTRYLTIGAGVSPTGDVTPDSVNRTTERITSIVAVDDFHRPNAPFATGDRSNDGVKWNSQGGATVLESALDDRAATGPHVHYVRTMATSHEVEAEVSWSGNSGLALILRLQDQNNFLMATVETNGVNARIYKIVAGVATQLGTTGTVSVPNGIWHKFRFSAIGNNLRFYVEDQLVVSVADATFNNMGNAGVRTGTVTAGTIHRIRHVIIRRRSEINV